MGSIAGKMNIKHEHMFMEKMLNFRSVLRNIDAIMSSDLKYFYIISILYWHYESKLYTFGLKKFHMKSVY